MVGHQDIAIVQTFFMTWSTDAIVGNLISRTAAVKRYQERECMYLEFDSFRHGSQMDRQMGSIGNEPTIWTEQRTGVVQSLFDVNRHRGSLQRPAHLFSNAHKPVRVRAYLCKNTRSTCYSPV